MPVDIPDFQFRQATMYRPTRLVLKEGKVFWQDFFNECAEEIFSRGGTILDIGGGMRIDPKRCNRIDPVRQQTFSHFLAEPTVSYIVSDYTAQYHPDIVEDIHALSLKEGSVDSVICLAVLEHVYDPKKAVEEIVRVLKPGGLGLLYVPFMYRYHANLTQDYMDYYRYSKDGISYLFRGCQELSICPVRGLFESLARFTPIHQLAPLRWILRRLDWSTERMRRISERQSSGYFIRIVR